MKNLLLILCTFVSAQIFAQTCTPDPTFADSAAGIYPLPFYADTQSGGITLDAAIGCPYEFVFQANVPVEVTLPQGTFELNHVDLTETGAVLNLPAGLNYACNPPDCFFEQATIGCVVLYGTPEASVTPGTFDLKILAEVSLLGNQLVLNDTFPGVLTNGGNYFLEVLSEPADPADCPVGIYENHVTPFEFTLAPNPTYGSTTLTINSEIRNELTFQIMNLTGQVIQSQMLQVEQGTNTYEMVVKDIPEGMYLYTLGNEEGVLTERIMITKQK